MISLAIIRRQFPFKIPICATILRLRIYDLNKSHIHPSTSSSALRTSPKSGEFCDISDWLSCVSNKLFHSWHGESYTY
ncbi:hypothetical protein Ahy_A09g042658 [Arachis hypogaea]|uniref:Uncharacterized protein n=1 Tax=Arachis hypogaea TaxID=3818 RepID=A0A445BGG0_ARAHY|nr:hypothetical protein Ahy_A09g042658 [Arachis hypogaea]